VFAVPLARSGFRAARATTEPTDARHNRNGQLTGLAPPLERLAVREISARLVRPFDDVADAPIAAT
jgi:hypothetical protein